MSKKNIGIAIYGATGFIGSKLSSYFIKNHYDTYCLTKNNNIVDTMKSLKKYEHRCIINCAFDFNSGLETNLKIVTDLNSYLKEDSKLKLINLSTIDAYSNPSNGFGMNNLPDTEYGKIKRSIDEFLISQNTESQLKILILGAVLGNGSSWHEMISSSYIHDYKYTDQEIPTIQPSLIFSACLEVMNKDSQFNIPHHGSLKIKNLNFKYKYLYFLPKSFLRNKYINLLPRLINKFGFKLIIQSNLNYFDKLSARSRGFT